MAGKTQHEAVTNFLDPLRRSIGCVTDGVLNGEHPQGRPPGAILKASLNGGTPAPLRGIDYSLHFAMSYRVVEADGDRGPFKVTTLEYVFTLLHGREKVVGWHWHPITTPERPSPHVHAYDSPMEKLHLPSGRVAVEHVALFAIDDLGAELHEPERDRKTIVDVLDRFEIWRTWA